MSLVDLLETFLGRKKVLDNNYRIEDDSEYESEFKIIREKSMEYKTNPAFACEEGAKQINLKKNRFKDILPYDYTRVVLDSSTGPDYINANFIEGSSGKKTYIAAQGPMPHTVSDFWRMVWQFKVSVIIMACNENENGKARCQRYWPQNETEIKEYYGIQIKLVENRKLLADHVLCRTLNATKDGEERVIFHFHYTGWPDHGVPEHGYDILDLLTEARKIQSHEDTPIVVHCSAGCGRTGTIIAIDYVRDLLKSEKLNENFNVMDLIDNLRRQRPALVQASEQYVFVYRAIGEMFERYLKQLSKNYAYENTTPNKSSPRSHLNNYENTSLYYNTELVPGQRPKVTDNVTDDKMKLSPSMSQKPGSRVSSASSSASSEACSLDLEIPPPALRHPSMSSNPTSGAGTKPAISHPKPPRQLSAINSETEKRGVEDNSKSVGGKAGVAGGKAGVAVEKSNFTGSFDNAVYNTVQPKTSPNNSRSSKSFGLAGDKQFENPSTANSRQILSDSAQMGMGMGCSVDSDSNAYAVVQHKSSTWTGNSSGKVTGAGAVSSNIATVKGSKSNVIISDSSTTLPPSFNPPSDCSMLQSNLNGIYSEVRDIDQGGYAVVSEKNPSDPYLGDSTYAVVNEQNPSDRYLGNSAHAVVSSTAPVPRQAGVYFMAGPIESVTESSYESYYVDTSDSSKLTKEPARTSPDVYYKGHLINFPHKVAKPKYAYEKPRLLSARDNLPR